jgi:hypothetical protein
MAKSVAIVLVVVLGLGEQTKFSRLGRLFLTVPDTRNPRKAERAPAACWNFRLAFARPCAKD